MSSEKLRVLVLSMFLFALLVFAAVYQPTKAMSGPASQTAATANQQGRQNQ